MDDQAILEQLYVNFNNRNIDAVLAFMASDVTWPNGWEGGTIAGPDEVRSYWLRQWQEINPTVVPVSFQRRPAGQIEVAVHQVIKGMDGQVISDGQVKHVYTFEDGNVKAMVIE